ncbi:hypothetical protein BD779DRAFT_174027 [Infundibulicybe gibba]|nr:hypothetical protein BD779DRAFT_174027 [Infundibulicybe gibba]
MNRLTHLALLCSEADLMQVFRAVVDETSVEVFVLVLSLDYATKDTCREVEDWVYEMREEGEDILYAVRPLCDDLEEEWDTEVRGGPTIWERAAEHTQELMDRKRLKVGPTMSVNLPLEVVHNILLYAAESSYLSCRTLCEVSTWVRCLALPMLYTTVAVELPPLLHRFIDLIASGHVTCPPTPAFCPADTVRNLCVPTDSRIFESIMRHCNNVTHLAIHQSNLIQLINSTVPKHPIPESSARQSHRRRRQTKAHEGTGDLQILLFENNPSHDWSLSSTFGDAGHPLFERITHLRLGDPVSLVARHHGRVLRYT